MIGEGGGGLSIARVANTDDAGDNASESSVGVTAARREDDARYGFGV